MHQEKAHWLTTPKTLSRVTQRAHDKIVRNRAQNKLFCHTNLSTRFLFNPTTANLPVTYAKEAAFPSTWQRAIVTNLLPAKFTQDKPMKDKGKKNRKRRLAAAKSKNEKQNKRILKNPRFRQLSSTKPVSRLAHQSKRRVYLKRAQQAASLTVPLSLRISTFYSALPCYQPCSALKCQKRPHISPSMQTAPGKAKKSSMWFICGDALWRGGGYSSNKMLTTSLEFKGCKQSDLPSSTRKEQKPFCLFAFDDGQNSWSQFQIYARLA